MSPRISNVRWMSIMPEFTIKKRVDAFIDYTTTVEADTASEAAEKARKSEGGYDWEADGEHEFDARLFVALDESDNEIEETRTGDF